MAHSNRSARKEKSAALKRAKKNAQKAKYADWTASGQNSKSARFKRKQLKRRLIDPNKKSTRNRRHRKGTGSTVSFKQFLRSL